MQCEWTKRSISKGGQVRHLLGVEFMRALVNEDRINGPEAQRIIVWTCRNYRWKLFIIYMQCTLLISLT